MGRNAHPFYWKNRRGWYASVHGMRNTKLLSGPNDTATKNLAYDKFYELMSQGPRSKSAKTIRDITELFLDWLEYHRSTATLEWYRVRLEKFTKKHGDMLVEELHPYHVQLWSDENPKNTSTTRRNKVQAVKHCIKWAKKLSGNVESVFSEVN